MFGDGHDLDCIIAELRNARQDILRKFLVSTNAKFILSHADMTLINQEWPLRVKTALLPVIFFVGNKKLRTPLMRFGILYNIIRVDRNALERLAMTIN